MGGPRTIFGSSGRSVAPGRSPLGTRPLAFGAAPFRAPPMPASKAQSAKRAFVRVLTALGRSYGVPVAVTQDSTDACLLRAYRRLLLKVHPDKGGRKADAQRLQVRALCHTPKSPARFQGSVPRLRWGRTKLSIYRGACQTVLCHFASRAALLSERLVAGPAFVTASPEPRCLSRALLPDRSLSALARSRLQMRRAKSCRGCLLLVRPVPGDSTLKSHCGVTIVRSRK